MKVNITGCVFGPDGKLDGIIDLEEKEAQRLVNLKVAEFVQVQQKQEQQQKQKTYKQMNCTEQTDLINKLTDVKELELLRDETKPSIVGVLDERIKSLTSSGDSAGQGGQNGQTGKGEE
jgi:hypothetical protein